MNSRTDWFLRDIVRHRQVRCRRSRCKATAAAAADYHQVNVTRLQLLSLQSAFPSHAIRTHPHAFETVPTMTLMSAAGTTPCRATASPRRGNGPSLQVPPPPPPLLPHIPTAATCINHRPPAPPLWFIHRIAGIAAVRGPPHTPLIHVLSCCTGTKCIGRSRLQVRERSVPAAATTAVRVAVSLPFVSCHLLVSAAVRAAARCCTIRTRK